MKTKAPFYKKLSISNRIALWYGLILFVLLSVFALFLHESFHESIHYNYDRHLHFEAQQLKPYIQIDDHQVSLDLSDYSRVRALENSGTFGTYVRLFESDGTLIYESPNLKNAPTLSKKIPDKITESSFSRHWQSLPARTVYFPIKEGNLMVGWLELTGFEWELHQDLSRFGRHLIYIILLSAFISIGGGYWLSQRALSPIHSLIRAVKSIKISDLDKRLPVNSNKRDELTELAETFNTMLDRIQKGFEREKRFISDAAHELMTPLACLQSNAEILLRKKRSIREYEESMKEMHGKINRMSTMVRLLTHLSHIESNQEVIVTPVNISAIIENKINKREVSSNKLPEIKTDLEPDLTVKANFTHIEEMVQNLIDNAVKFTPEGGTIQVTLSAIGDNTLFKVKDNGIGFDPYTKNHLFERFYRSDHPEVQDHAGSGLGLALVQSIVNLYGGTIEAFSEGLDKGSTFKVLLPFNSERPQFVEKTTFLEHT